MTEQIREAKGGAVALVAVLVFIAAMLSPRDAARPDAPVSAVEGEVSECSRYALAAGEVRALYEDELRAALEVSGLPEHGYDPVRFAGHKENARGIVELGRRCRGYSDAALGLGPVELQLLGLEPNEEKP
jgi:hypothetical protein